MIGWFPVLAFAITLSAGAPLAAEAIAPGTAGLERDANGEFLFRHYPKRALDAGQEGKVGFRVTLARDGTLTSCEVRSSSGYPALDNETCELLVAYARFEAPRLADGSRTAIAHDGVVAWRLPPEHRAKTAAMPVARSKSAAVDQDKIICKTQTRTGSLVGRTRQCLTRRQWTQAASIAQRELQEAQGKGHSTCSPPAPC